MKNINIASKSTDVTKKPMEFKLKIGQYQTSNSIIYKSINL